MPKQRPFWLAQALASEADTPSPVLNQPIHADVCIIGGGFTGLWTAIQLKQQAPHCQVVILEADLCGAGASGRNGGCVLSWATKYLTLKRLFGEAEAIRLVQASEQAIETIGQFCQRHQIDCDFRYDGVLYTATTSAQIGSTDGVIEQLSQRGLNSYAPLSVNEVRQRAGSTRHLAGVFSPRGATVQPGKLVRGLRRVALELGVQLYEQSAVLRLEESTVPVVHTRKGYVKAARVVMAMNAWTPQLFPAFARKLVVVSSDMVITESDPAALAATGLNSGVAVLDSRTFVYYYHNTSDGRLMLGKGGNTFSYGAQVLPVFDQPSPYRAQLGQALAEFFPALANTPIAASWNGPSDRSCTGLPFFGQLNQHPHIFYGLGYSGNGVGPSYLGGKILAALALGQDNAWTRSGLVSGPRGQFPPEPLRYVGSLMVRNAIRRKERAEDAQRQPWVWDNWLARLADAAGKADHA